MTSGRRCEAMAALRSDVDLVSWPSDSDMTVVRVGKESKRRRLRAPPGGRLGDGEAGEAMQPCSPSLVNLTTVEVAESDDVDDVQALTSWGLSPWDTALELGDVLRCCPPQREGGADWPFLARTRLSSLPSTSRQQDLVDDADVPDQLSRDSPAIMPACACETLGDCIVVTEQPRSAWWRSAWDAVACARCRRSNAMRGPPCQACEGCEAV